jgi:oleate hydratase
LRSKVSGLGFESGSDKIKVNSLEYASEEGTTTVAVAPGDLVFVTNGSMTAGKSFGSMTSAPAKDREGRNGAWQLWETLSAGRPEFGNPAVFDDHVDESTWVSFTVTVNDPIFFNLMQAFSGSEAGKGGLITFKDSAWLLTLSIFHQPFFAGQPKGVFVWWGYGLYHDRVGNFVKKTMQECSGHEILEEVIGQLRFDADRDTIMTSSICIPCMMPYITSQFLVRKQGDRPDVVPARSTNLAFIGQFAELPDDVVFTVEYSVRSAQIAVYKLLHLPEKPSPFYKGQHDPKVLWEALKTLHR